MTTARDDPGILKRKPGPKPRGRTVLPLTIAVTMAQRALLDGIAARECITVSAVVRRLIVAGLAASDAHVPSL